MKPKIEIWSKRYMEGWWKQTLVDPMGRVIDDGPFRRFQKNLIVDKAGDLLTWFLSGLLGTASGIQYYVIGSGLASWDTAPVTADPADTTLQTELESGGVATSRKVPTITFLDSSDVPTLTKTDRLQLDVSYASTELNGTHWREFGIFGGDADASTPDTGYMINHVTHDKQTKSSAFGVNRTTRFKF